MAGILDGLAHRRFLADPSAAAAHDNWEPYPLPPVFADLDTRFFRSDRTGRLQGGLFGLDGVHPTTSGYGIIAQAVLDVLTVAQVASTPIDVARLRAQDTLNTHPPGAVPDAVRPALAVPHPVREAVGTARYRSGAEPVGSLRTVTRPTCWSHWRWAAVSATAARLMNPVTLLQPLDQVVQLLRDLPHRRLRAPVEDGGDLVGRPFVVLEEHAHTIGETGEAVLVGGEDLRRVVAGGEMPRVRRGTPPAEGRRCAAAARCWG